jgi:enamine deaminase RidA (YjgF/YER057c/UK114 family)
MLNRPHIVELGISRAGMCNTGALCTGTWALRMRRHLTGKSLEDDRHHPREPGVVEVILTPLTHPKTTMSVYDQLKELNITLPPVSVPVAAYVPYVQSGNLVFLSGHIARKDGKPWAAQLGRNITTEEGKAAARAVAIDLMGTLQAACGGDLNRVQRIVKVMSLVNSTGDFTEHHLVTNGASELLGQVFGEKGVHARSAFGVAQTPMGACVEIELIAELA